MRYIYKNCIPWGLKQVWKFLKNWIFFLQNAIKLSINLEKDNYICKLSNIILDKVKSTVESKKISRTENKTCGRQLNIQL